MIKKIMYILQGFKKKKENSKHIPKDICRNFLHG
jgi:hypothetical protein